MNGLLKLEELAQFIFSIVLFCQLNYGWWVYPCFILMPDLSMIGYLANPKAGSFFYNLFHHKLIAISILIIGFWLNNSLLELTGIIMFGHASMDRIFGYGLKYNDNFKNTHLGWIGQRD